MSDSSSSINEPNANLDILSEGSMDMENIPVMKSSGKLVTVHISNQKRCSVNDWMARWKLIAFYSMYLLSNHRNDTITIRQWVGCSGSIKSGSSSGGCDSKCIITAVQFAWSTGRKLNLKLFFSAKMWRIFNWFMYVISVVAINIDKTPAARAGPWNRSNGAIGRRRWRDFTTNCRWFRWKHRECVVYVRQASQSEQSWGERCSIVFGTKLEYVDTRIWHRRTTAIQTGRRDGVA